MVKKQDSHRQLHLLREVKRKAQADQEARLQQTLARISKQEAQSSASTQRTRGSTSTAPAFYKYYAVRRGRVCNVIYSTWAECKAQVHQFPGAEYKSFPTYAEAQGYLSIGVNRRTNFFDRRIKIIFHQSHVPIPILNQILQYLQKLNRNESW